jgi:hypothetical protein
VPKDVPLILTLTPTNGSPLSDERTTPCIGFVCAETVHEKNRASERKKRIFFILIKFKEKL